jgi:hypothetical protein
MEKSYGPGARVAYHGLGRSTVDSDMVGEVCSLEQARAAVAGHDSSS